MPDEAPGRIEALAVDHDRTLTDDALRPHPPARRALRHPRVRGRRVVVSGRGRDFLAREIGDAADLLVAENGCVLRGADGRTRRLGEAHDGIHRSLSGVAFPLERGEVLCAADVEHERLLRAAIDAAGVRAALIRDRVMVLPRGVDKAAGALAAIAMENAIPEFRDEADRVTRGFGGAGIARWIEEDWLAAEVVA